MLARLMFGQGGGGTGQRDHEETEVTLTFLSIPWHPSEEYATSPAMMEYQPTGGYSHHSM